MKTGPQATEAQTGDDLDFRIRSRDEIVRILRHMAKSRETLTVSFDAGKESMPSLLLGVDAPQDRVIFDNGPEEEVNRRLLQSAGATLLGRHNLVQVRFEVGKVERISVNGGPAFAARLPEWIVRMQRRKFYRLIAPADRPLSCRFTLPDGTPISTVVLDISLGGIGILQPPSVPPERWEPTTIIKEARIELPDSTLLSDLEVRGRAPLPSPGRSPRFRIGCRFVSPSPRMPDRIQSYINRIELERRRKGR
jgi:c-di-GMP-binding flagellar brake protein YcgR